MSVDLRHMRRALELAAQGRGAVEPNPMVGCVIAREDRVIAEGYHRRFGGLHAEAEALRIAQGAALGATLYVTLEPCCHYGKTPPCTSAIIQAGVARVVAAMRDPNPLMRGQGFRQLLQAGVAVDVGLAQHEAEVLNAPYLTRLSLGRPWVVAKWAMTLDGKIATRTGESRWISGARSRQVVHELRGRMDAIMIGRGTALADDPLLTARPPGPRLATRIVLDSLATLPTTARLVQTAHEVPVLVAVSEAAPAEQRQRLVEADCEVLTCSGSSQAERLQSLLQELGGRNMTNVLVEGGATLLGQLFDQRLMDEVHIFIGAKLFGGAAAPSPLAGQGLAHLADSILPRAPHVELVDGDIYVQGRLR